MLRHFDTKKIQDELLRTYVRQKCAKKIVVEARRSFTNGCKVRIDAKEDDAECLVGLERN